MMTWTFTPSKQVLEILARAEGYKQGCIEGRQISITTVLGARFGALPVELTDAIQSTKDMARLKSVFNLAVLCASLEDFRRDAQL